MDYYKPQIRDKTLYVPSWWHEDLPQDGILQGAFYVYESDNPQSLYNSLRNQRREMYFACQWYPKLVDANIPTIPSQLLRSTFYDIREDLKTLWNHSDPLGTSKFVRLCGGSPKDGHETCIFINSNRATDAIMSSQRTLSLLSEYHAHLMVRQVMTINQECRCFIHNHQLRAVSIYHFCPLDHEVRAELEYRILDFFDIYGFLLPYHSCVMELGLNDDQVFVIEFNSFGVDLFAGASLFDWDKDMVLLHHSETPIFRYPLERSVNFS